MCVGLADPENTVVRYVDSLHYSNWPFKQEATNLAVSALSWQGVWLQ